MKITASASKAFKPIIVSITMDTPEDYAKMWDVMGFNCSVPELVSEGDSEKYRWMQEFMIGIRKAMEAAANK